MAKFSFPCKSPIMLEPPYKGEAVRKFRFYANVNDLPQEFLGWMALNPREQNLTGPVAKTIAKSLLEPHKEFHLRNRGILLAAQTVQYQDNMVEVEMVDRAIHGNIDGGHTLKVILAAEKPLPEKYVEFEILTGLDSAVEVAEARNTSAALDLRSLEEAKNTFAVLKQLFDGQTIGGNRFCDRIEWKQNQQQAIKNSIDIRIIIALILALNQKLFPSRTADGKVRRDNSPVGIYGAGDAAVKKFISLADNQEERNDILRHMAPILMGVMTLWDTVEMEFGCLNKSYARKSFVVNHPNQQALFSDQPVPYYVPQAILLPIICSFRMLVGVDPEGTYYWLDNPFDAWNTLKMQISKDMMGQLKLFRDSLSKIGKSKVLWSGLEGILAIYFLREK